MNRWLVAGAGLALAGLTLAADPPRLAASGRNRIQPRSEGLVKVDGVIVRPRARQASLVCYYHRTPAYDTPVVVREHNAQQAVTEVTYILDGA